MSTISSNIVFLAQDEHPVAIDSRLLKDFGSSPCGTNATRMTEKITKINSKSIILTFQKYDKNCSFRIVGYKCYILYEKIIFDPNVCAIILLRIH